MREVSKFDRADDNRVVSRVEEDDEIDLMELAGTLWRGKWTIALCAIVAILLGGYYAYAVAVPKYATTTKLALQLRNEQVVDIESVMAGVSTETSAINTELEVIRSSGLLEQLVEELDLTTDPEFNEDLRPEPTVSMAIVATAVRSILGFDGATEGDDNQLSPAQRTLNNTVANVRDAITALNLRDTYIFNIGATTQAQMKSAEIANTLADLYIQNQIDVKFQATENAVAWLSERVVELEAELRAKENEVKDLLSEMQLSTPEALSALNQQVRDTRERLGDTRANVGLLEARLSELERLEQQGDASAIAAALDDPTLNRLATQIDQGQDNIGELFDNRVALLMARADTNLARSEQQENALSGSLARLEQQVSEQSEDLLQLQQMQRDAEVTRTLYETFLTRLRETSVQRGVQQADSRVLSVATPGEYVEPRKSRILALAMILGAMIGMGIVVLRQFMRKGFRTSDELEAQSGISVIGQIPKMPIRKRRELIDFLNNKPTSAGAEAIRNLRTSILLSNIDNPPQVIMSTSAVPGEGKTTQSIALAHNLSGLGKKVLLIEGDIRRRTFTEYFELPEGHGGLVSAMTGEKPLNEVLVRDSCISVDVLMGEKSNINAADIFSSEKFKQFLTSVRKSYDYIIIDTPPVLVVPDARVIGQSVDAVVFSTAWDRTPKAQVIEALRQLSSVNVRVTGLVLAQIDAKGMKRYGYGADYGSYAGYYEA